MNTQELIGKRLRKLRKNAGLAIESAALQAGLSTEMLDRIEEGMAQPYLAEAAKLALVYDTTVSDIVKLVLPKVPDSLPEDIGGDVDGQPPPPPRRRGMLIAVITLAALVPLLTAAGYVKGKWDGEGSKHLPLEDAIAIAQNHSYKDQNRQAAVGRLYALAEEMMLEIRKVEENPSNTKDVRIHAKKTLKNLALKRIYILPINRRSDVRKRRGGVMETDRAIKRMRGE